MKALAGKQSRAVRTALGVAIALTGSSLIALSARADMALSGDVAGSATTTILLPPAEVGTQTLRPVSLESPLGQKVETANGEDAGRVVDILTDSTGQLRAAVIEFGGFLGVGTKKVAVAWDAVRFSAGAPPTLVVDVTRDQLRTAPQYKAAKASTQLKSFY